MASERRRHSRVDEAVCTWVSFPRDGAAYGTLTADLGPQGARFCACRNVHVSEKVVLHFQFPSTSIGCEGFVCWVQTDSPGQCMFGVQFQNLPEVERDYLRRHVTHVSMARVA